MGFIELKINFKKVLTKGNELWYTE